MYESSFFLKTLETALLNFFSVFAKSNEDGDGDGKSLLLNFALGLQLTVFHRFLATHIFSLLITFLSPLLL